MLRRAIWPAFFLLYSKYEHDSLHQTESILYQVGDGADKSDRPLLYRRAGEIRFSPTGIWPSLLGDATSAGEFPGAPASFPAERGLAGISTLTDLLAGGSLVGCGFADLGLGG